jgi:hypothetical protein
MFVPSPFRSRMGEPSANTGRCGGMREGLAGEGLASRVGLPGDGPGDAADGDGRPRLEEVGHGGVRHLAVFDGSVVGLAGGEDELVGLGDGECRGGGHGVSPLVDR